MPYAVVRLGGKQVRVAEGSRIRVEKMDGVPGTRVELADVLLVSDGKETKVGRPKVAGAKVLGTITAQGRGEKLMVFKDRNRKGIRRHMGHRQWHTELSIQQIVTG